MIEYIKLRSQGNKIVTPSHPSFIKAAPRQQQCQLLRFLFYCSIIISEFFMLLTSPSSFYTAESMFIPVDLDTCIVLNALAFVVVVLYNFHLT